MQCLALIYLCNCARHFFIIRTQFSIWFGNKFIDQSLSNIKAPIIKGKKITNFFLILSALMQIRIMHQMICIQYNFSSYSFASLMLSVSFTIWLTIAPYVNANKSLFFFVKNKRQNYYFTNHMSQMMLITILVYFT